MVFLVHTNFSCLIRRKRSCGRIPGGNKKQVEFFLGVGGGRYGVDKMWRKIKNCIQWFPRALDRSEMTRVLPGVRF